MSWAPLREDLNDVVEAAWQQGLPYVSYQYSAGKDYQVRSREGEGGSEGGKCMNVCDGGTICLCRKPRQGNFIVVHGFLLSIIAINALTLSFAE